MPYFALDGDGNLVEKFSHKKKALDAYELNNLIHVVVDQNSRVWAGEAPADLDIPEAVAYITQKPKPEGEKKSGGQRGGRSCPSCKGHMSAALPASDAKNLRGVAFRKCDDCGFQRTHPIAHVAMLLAETGWPEYRNTLGGGQRAARRVIELNIAGIPGPEAYAQTVAESKTWEGWAPGREAQRKLNDEKKAAEKAAKDAEKADRAADREAAKEAKAAERLAEKERKAAERAAAKEAKAKAKADAEQIEGQETIDA